MKYIYLTLGWIFGVIFALAGLLSMAESPAGGACLIVVSLLLLPPFRNFVYVRTNKSISTKARSILILGLFIIFGAFAGVAQERQEQELAAQQAKAKAEAAAKERQEKIAYFNSNKPDIMARLGEFSVQKDYESVISLSAKYLVSGDADLLNINQSAKEAITERQKTEKTDEILSKLKSIPSSEFEGNRALYFQLSKMHPDNDQYKKKLAFYAGKVEEENKARIAAEEREKRIKEQFSGWDGSHTNLTRLIKKAMNDPKSYEHDETVYWDRGDHLVVRTSYRGKNAFGGVVRNFVRAKVSLDGQIIEILEQS